MNAFNASLPLSDSYVNACRFRGCILTTLLSMTTAARTQELFRRADAVCLDVDSTVIREEGIDELAKFCGVGDAVTEMSVTRLSHTNTKHSRVCSLVSRCSCSARLCPAGPGTRWAAPCPSRRP